MDCLIFFDVHEQLIQVVQVLSLECQKLGKFLVVYVFDHIYGIVKSYSYSRIMIRQFKLFILCQRWNCNIH